MQRDAVTDNGTNVGSWSDDDFTANKKDRKSITEEVIVIDGAVVQWTCK